MSGLVVGYGQPDLRDARRMLDRIAHRGPDLSGIWQQNRVLMAQNYLAADLLRRDPSLQIPVSAGWKGALRICLDGQLGNWQALAMEHGNIHGLFPEEQLLLHLYKQYGCDMLRYLNDATFAFVISDGVDLLAARDVLGIKTLFYGMKDSTIYLASELKSLLAVTDDVHEFPPGHYMDRRGRLTRFAGLPRKPPELMKTDVGQMTEAIREIIERSFRTRVTLSKSTGGLLSGGLDSSVICGLGSQLYREKYGRDARLKTFAMGVGESEDILSARAVAEHIGSEHHELIVNFEQVLETLPEVIYYLESFDPSLVRSSVSNFLISGYSREQGMDVLLSGEGGDEVFCGYTYLKQFTPEELFSRQVECLGYLHNNASLRLDRMNQCHSLRVVTPLISGKLLDYALRIPPEYKQKPEGGQKIEKWIFRKAFEGDLPDTVVWRTKQEFSQGTGSADLLPDYFEAMITDGELARAREKYPLIRSKEELHYFRVFTEHFGSGKALDTVGQWICL